MKRIILFFFTCSTIFLTNQTAAQWNLSGTSVRLNNNTWNVGIGTQFPNSKLHVNTTAAGQNGLRVQIAGSTKFLVANGGGASVGSLTTPPVNGLFVAGNAGIGTSAPAVKLQVSGGADASPAGGGFIVSGSVSGANIAIDDNEIMARSNGAASNLFLNHNGGNLLINGTNSTTSGGNVGIRTTAPAVDVHLNHGIGSGSTHGLRLENTGTNNEDWTFYVQNSTGFLELYADGIFRGSFNDVSGAYSAVSDKRLKKDFEPAGVIMPKIMQLGVQKYNFIKGKPSQLKHYGMIAQDVEKIFPEVVNHSVLDNGEDVYTMDYSALGVLAIKAIQEMQPKLEEQQQKIQLQQEKINTLEERLAQLEATLASLAANKNVKTGLTELSSGTLESYPNPFKQSTTIRYSLPQGGKGEIKIYNEAGQLVKTLIANVSGQSILSGVGLKSGTYTYSLTINGKTSGSKKLVLLK
jgi:hypothetical protein